MTPQRLVLLVEGKGDLKAVPVLTNRVLGEKGGFDTVFVDPVPLEVRNLGNLLKQKKHGDGERQSNWLRWLQVAGQRSNTAAVVLVLDGDLQSVPSTWSRYKNRFDTLAFCPYQVASLLAEDAKVVGAGTTFSLAVAFVMREFETWLLAGLPSIRGQPLAGARGSVPLDAASSITIADLENHRDAKGELRRSVPAYSETLDQHELARKVALSELRQLRSFQHFETALNHITQSVRNGRHVVLP